MSQALEDVLPIIIVFSMPLAIVLAIVFGLIFRMYLKHKVEMFDHKLRAENQLSNQTQGEIAALRRELSQLRDTATQYDVSIQHTLEELQQRMARLEGIVRPAALAAPVQEQPEEPARIIRS